MSHNTNQQQQYNNNTGGQGMPSSDIKYDRDLQQNYWLPCPTNNVFYASSPGMAASMMEQQERNVPIFSFRNINIPPTTRYDHRDLQQNDALSPTNVFYTEPGSDSSSPLVPASMEQKGSSHGPLFMLRSKPPLRQQVQYRVG
eukprot:scaffold135122_cov54-Attheya_sp.AAC.5